MRTELAELEGQTLEFRAKFSYNSKENDHACFVSVTQNGNNVADHIWIFNHQRLKFKSRCIYQFTGKVRRYWKSQTKSFDYQISYVTAIQLVIERI